MAVSTEDVPLLTACEEDEDFDEVDRLIHQVQADRRNRQELQFQKNTLHLDVPRLPAGKSHHVFISHCNQSAERSWAKDLVTTLEQYCGLKCVWPERDFLPGENIGTLIQRGILGAMKIVIVLTPDSVESEWCKYEAEFAFGQSINSGENNIIPVLLSPCQVPDLLKTMNYIDVPKGEDYVFRIRRCFDEDNRDMTMLNPVVQPFIRNTDDPTNGKHAEIIAYRNLKHICRGPSWSFRDLTPHERVKLRQAGGKFSEKVYFDARNIANNASVLKFYSIAYSCKHCCPLWCCLVVITLILLALGINLVEIIKGEIFFFSFWGDLAIIGFVCCGIVSSMFLFNYRNAGKLKKQLIRYSLDHVFETKILVAFFEGHNAAPKLVFAYYDLKPCLDHFSGIMADAERIEDETEEMRTQRARQYLFSLIQDNYELLVKSRLPMSVVHRHPTYLRQKCLCEFAQEKLWKIEV